MKTEISTKATVPEGKWKVKQVDTPSKADGDIPWPDGRASSSAPTVLCPLLCKRQRGPGRPCELTGHSDTAFSEDTPSQ